MEADEFMRAGKYLGWLPDLFVGNFSRGNPGPHWLLKDWVRVCQDDGGGPLHGFAFRSSRTPSSRTMKGTQTSCRARREGHHLHGRHVEEVLCLRVVSSTLFWTRRRTT